LGVVGRRRRFIQSRRGSMVVKGGEGSCLFGGSGGGGGGGGRNPIPLRRNLPFFVFSDTTEGPRAPAVRPGRVSVTPFALFTNSGCGRVSEWEKGRGAERLRERKEKERKKREERESGREHR
jgi:hypothetical protein